MPDRTFSAQAIWQANFGATTEPIASASTMVPEPATGIMLMLAMAVLLGRGERIPPWLAAKPIC